MNFLLLPLLMMLAAFSAPAVAQTPSSTMSITYSGSLSTSYSGTVSTSYSNTLSVTVSGSLSISLNLQPPQNVRNLTPNQRQLVTVGWNQPPGYFYPSYNIYYFTSADSTLREITGISALQYALKYPAVPQITPGLTITVYVTGVASNGVESPKSAALVTMTSSADPKLQPSLGITNFQCTVASTNVVTCSYTLGQQAFRQLNVRIKCPRQLPGAPRIRRLYIKGTTTTSFSINLSRSAGQTCKISYRAIYVPISSTTSSGPYPRFGRKTRPITVTLNAA